MPIAISIRNLTKTFTGQTSRHEKIRALNGISLDVKKGEVLGILGPNGAGKTTLLNILSTLLLPDSGEVNILGVKSKACNYNYLRTFLNMSSGHPNFPWSLTVEDNLLFYGRLYGLRGKALKERVNELIESFYLNAVKNVRFDELSSGTKQRLSLAKALINEPKILFLDEPTIGLDPDVAAKTRGIIRNIIAKTQMTVLFTTHNMPEAEEMCNRIAFINKGELIKLATPDELKIDLGRKDLEEVFIDLSRRGIADKKDFIQSFDNNDSEIKSVKYSKNECLAKDLLKETYLWFNRVYAFTFRNTLFALRNVFAFVELVFWPIVSLISIGLMGDFLALGGGAWNFIMTGAIAAGVLQVTQLDVAYSLLYEVWSKSVKHTFLTPVGVSESIFGSWITGIVRGVIVLIILALSAVFLFGFKFPPMGTTIIFLFGMFVSSLLLGILVTFLILIFGQKAEITAWMFAYLFMMICGIYYPVETLPKVLYLFAQLLPITYFLEYFRTEMGFPAGFSNLLLKGFGLSVIYLILGLNLMRYSLRKARKNATLVRLSE